MFSLEKIVHYRNHAVHLLLFAGMGAVLFCEPVNANSEAPQTPEEALVLETFEVTGSRIPRVDTEGVAPLVLFDREDIERSGATTINEFFRDMVYTSAGIVDEQFTQGFAPGTSGVDLRGLGVNRTLVLLDGRRLSVYPFGQEGTRSFVDINSIPLAAIERIEILKDGASAIYGADAVAGVVNFITRKEMDGFEGTSQLGMADEGDGKEGHFSAVTGKNWNKTSATLVVDYLNREAVMAEDRDITSSANGPIDDRSFLGNPGTGIPLSTGLPQADANCPPDRVIANGPATFCGYDFAPHVTLIPETERLGLVGNLEHRLSDGLRVFGSAMFSYSYSERDLAPTNNAPDLFFVSDTNPTNPLGEDMVVLYRMEELGPRRDEFETTAYNFVTGIDGYVGSWDWQFALGYSRVDTEIDGVNGYAAAADLQAAVDSGTLNLFGDSPAFDPDSVAYETSRDGMSKHYYADFEATGKVLDLSTGAVQMAVGAEIRREEFSDRFDDLTESGAILGVGGVSAKGDRDLQSAYAEFSVPAAKNLEIQLAGRFDHYSDFNNTFNPKLGVRWQPLGNLLLRTSVGTGFKAPALHELYSGDILSFESLVDGGNLVSDVPTTTTGNPELDPEESRSLNLGFVWDITPQWDLGVDGWYLQNKNAVTNDPQYILDNEFGYPGLVQRDGLGNLVSINSPFENIAAQKLWGIDFDTGVNWKIERVGNFRVGLVGSYLGAFKEEAVDGEGFENLAGEDGRPKFRGKATLGWSRATYSSSLVINYIGKYERPDVDDKIGSWTTVDTQVNWSPQFLSGGTVTFGVENVFDQDPPKDPYLEGWPFINRALHNARGRFGYLRYLYRF